jgi:hypothetical protein
MYSLTSGEQYVIDQAVAILADECQAKEGFDVEITVGDGSGDNFGPPMVDETLGLIDASAAPYGYRGNPNRSDGEVSGGLSVGWADTEDAREAVWECQRQAAGQLTGGEPADEKLPWDIKHAAEAEVGGDPDYRDATQKWSECMARGGFDYAAPADPWLDPAHGYKSCDEDGALSELALDRPSRLSRTDLEELLAGVECEAPIPVTDAEIQVAEADVECKAEVGLVPAFRAALWKAQEARIEANLPALEKRLELERKRLERAGKIIAER